MAKNPCKVCRHDQVKAINKALVSGETLQSLADKYGLHISSLSRHKSCIANKISKFTALTDASEGASVLQNVYDLLQKAQDLLDQAESSGDFKTALVGIRECRACLELMARISGEISPEKIQIMIAPVVNSVVQVLRAEINDPDILHRIHDRLLKLEQRSD